ncbi:hypothetical protein [Belnapia sp. F-4-1]|uniref:hypothetical protein n=1 Tax=Belnapia sp. F-4-1 TaxID=1545443 RepID=UPI0005B95369|nr:hypothetical protein [Belnapia sp. F-4-1]
MYVSSIGLAPDTCLPHGQTTTLNTAISVYLANGLCGSGKTYASADQIAEGILRGERYLIAGPTVQQSRQHAEAIRAALHRLKLGGTAALLVVEVNAETERRAINEHQPSVAQVITATAAATPKGRGRALCITHAALLNMPRRATPKGWHLLIDEVPAAAVPAEVELPTLYLKALRFVLDDRDNLPRLRADLDHLAEIKRDAEQQVRDLEGLGSGAADPDGTLDREIAQRRSIRDTLTDLYYKLKSGNWRILARRGALEPDGKHRLRLRLHDTAMTRIVLTSMIDWQAMVGVVQPRWQSTTIMAANVAQSFAAITLRRQGFHLLDHPTITPRLRYQDAHPNGHLLRVLYLSSRPMSKHLRDKVVEGGRMRDIITAVVEDRMTDLDYCWSANLDMPDTCLRGTRMPFVSHGLNTFQTYRNVVVLNIANLNPQCMQAMTELGFTPEQVREAIMAESVYQAVCRSALRDPANTEPVVAVVPDLACAEFVAERFPGCRMSALGETEPPVAFGRGRPRQHLDDATRKREAREVEQARRDASIEAWRSKLMAEVLGEPVWQCQFYASKTDGKAGIETRFDSFNDIRALLDDWFALDPASDKAENNLIMQGELRSDPASRNAHGGLTHRATPNIVSRSSIWLDIETQGKGASGPPISPSALRALLPGYAMSIYTSFNHEPTAFGTRYRVVIPLSHRVGPNAYKAVGHLLRDHIEQARWFRFNAAKGASASTRYHGLDPSKDNATSIFYLPCRRAGHEADHWIEHYDGEPMDVVEWLGRDMSRVIPDDQIIRPSMPKASETNTIDRLLSASGRAAAIDRYLALPSGTQDYALNQLAWSLAGMGIGMDEIRHVLDDCARQSNSPQDRAAQVGRIMKHLARKA